ncbi:hypothetical protein V6N13_071705 [Hibiscus sabdariffa]
MDDREKDNVADLADFVEREQVLVIILFEIIVEVEKVMMIDRGYIFSQFKTNSKNLNCKFENVRVLVIDQKNSAIKYIIPLLEKNMQLRSHLLIIVEDIPGEVLATLMMNNLQDIINVATITAPSFG